MTLKLLFTKGGLQYQLQKNRTVTDENSWFLSEESEANLLKINLESLLKTKELANISVISAFNKFALTPADFLHHNLGHQLISYNAQTNPEKDELMLTVNKKHDVQFYFAFPKSIYNILKSSDIACNFNFSGEKFLNSIHPKNGKEIHINLYHNQCEFFAIENRKIILYNNLDVNSEVDFLYFIMFTISKLNFNLSETSFLVYGETSENETFISELRKFVKNLKIGFDNYPKNNFILN